VQIEFTGGCRTDDAPVSATPFVYYSENVRWRNGRPETVDLFTRLRTMDGDPVSIPVTDPEVTSWSDRGALLFGVGNSIWVYRYDTEEVSELPVPDAAPSGRWWFAYTEEEIFCARSSLEGRVHVIDRATYTIRVLPNSPVGALCGGIVNGCLVLGGTTSYAAEIGAANPSPPELTVRWSARRTDPSSSGTPAGPFGFEDWIPSDLNSAGDNVLDTGVSIIGGGETRFGFMLWTDAMTYVLKPRTDTLVFSRERVGPSGLYASTTWVEQQSAVYWLDSSRRFNRYDGGPIVPLVNPLSSASTELMENETINASMAVNERYPEIMLLYRDGADVRRQLVYNTVENVWYPFRFDWLTFVGRKGEVSAAALRTDGAVVTFSPREAQAADAVYPPGVPRPDLGRGDLNPEIEVEPFDFFFSTNIIVTADPLRNGPRTLNAVLAHTYGTDPRTTSSPLDDTVFLQFDSFDRAAQNARLVHTDRQPIPVGAQGADFRGGGKAVQITVWGEQVRSFLRFGTLFVDTIDGARR
jgi:hypothetical protein